MKTNEIIVEQTSRNPVIDLTPYFQNYEQIYAEVVNVNPSNGTAQLKIIIDKLKPGAKPSDKIEVGKRKGIFPMKLHYIKRAKLVR